MRSAVRTLSWRKKLAFSIATLFLFAIACEAVLRAVDPEIIRFAVAYRRSHSYPDKRGGLEPNVAEEMHVTLSDGTQHFRFLLATDRFGVRRPATSADNPPMPRYGDQTIIHCLGDSYTMGWGVESEESYPARLGEILGPEYYVLNLGVDGIGLIESIEQSRQVAETFPPDVIIYLFCINDIADDVQAESANQAWSSNIVNSIRRLAVRNSYLANLPKALALRPPPPPRPWKRIPTSP